MDVSPYVFHSRIFGNEAYMHIMDNLKTKLDDKGSKCILIGYNEHSKAYK